LKYQFEFEVMEDKPKTEVKMSEMGWEAYY
jgi:hypothetical protein